MGCVVSQSETTNDAPRPAAEANPDAPVGRRVVGDDKHMIPYDDYAGQRIPECAEIYEEGDLKDALNDIEAIPENDGEEQAFAGNELPADGEQQTTPYSGQPVIMVLGGPGSGKGTLCESLWNTYNFVHLSTGELLRLEVMNGTEIGAQAEEFMNEGQLVPDEIVMMLLRNAMESNSYARGFLLDGYPRNVDQMTAFEEQIRPVDMIIFLSCTDDVMMERLMKRAETSGRADDNEETFKKRIATFAEQTAPVVEANSSRVEYIPADGEAEEVFNAVSSVIDSKLLSNNPDLGPGGTTNDNPEEFGNLFD